MENFSFTLMGGPTAMTTGVTPAPATSILYDGVKRMVSIYMLLMVRLCFLNVLCWDFSELFLPLAVKVMLWVLQTHFKTNR